VAINFGTLVAKRLERIYRKIGQDLIISGGFGSQPFVGRVSKLVFDEMAQEFTSAEYSTWSRPAYKVQIAGDFRISAGGPSVGYTVDLPDQNGLPGAVLTYTVRKIDRSIFANVAYRTTLYLSRT
jgi:hypothetical protein